MRLRKGISVVGSIAAAIAMTLAVWGGHVAAQTRLQVGGNSSNFGRGRLAGGFVPDPHTVAITSGGQIDASSLGLGPTCRGFVTRPPDYILDYSAPASFLRFYFQSGGDATLIINDGSNRWQCNDDSFGGTNPTVDINRPPAGHYDIWVGSYRAGENLRGTLHVTELRTQHP